MVSRFPRNFARDLPLAPVSRGRPRPGHEGPAGTPPPSPDAKIDPGSAAGVFRIPLKEASGTSCGAPPPSSNSLLSLCESRGQVDVFPCPDSPFFPKPMGLASPGTVPTKVHNALQVHLESHV